MLGSTNNPRTLVALADLCNVVRTNQGTANDGSCLDAKCVDVLTAAALDTSNAVLVATMPGAHRIAELEARVRSLELQLEGFQDVAQKLVEVAQVACSMPASAPSSAPATAPGSPAPWFTDAAMELPFALPSLRASPGCESQSIGELIVSDLKHNDFEQLCQRYECETPHIGGGAEASTIGGNSWHCGSECGGAWASTSM